MNTNILSTYIYQLLTFCSASVIIIGPSPEITQYFRTSCLRNWSQCHSFYIDSRPLPCIGHSKGIGDIRKETVVVTAPLVGS